MINHIRLWLYSFNSRYLFLRKCSNSLGDNVLLSSLTRPISIVYPDRYLVVETAHPDLFVGNPFVDIITAKSTRTTSRVLLPRYSITRRTDTPVIGQLMQFVIDEPRPEIEMSYEEHRQQLAQYHRKRNQYLDIVNHLSGKYRYPEVFVRDEEIDAAQRKYGKSYIVINPHETNPAMKNIREWTFENFQAVRDAFPDIKFIQVGRSSEKLLKHTVDGRSLPTRELCGLLAGAKFYFGIEGGLMHLAKAVRKRSLIILGGFVKPEITCYEDDVVLHQTTDCSPCYSTHKSTAVCVRKRCMEAFTPAKVAGVIRDRWDYLCEPVPRDYSESDSALARLM